LVGAGIMSATLGALLRLVEPDWSMTLVERLDGAAAESSDAWNNAGTGHSGLCELNYTPERPDGSIDISKAAQVNEQFQVTRQFWAYAVENGLLPDVRSFLNPIPHVSFVHGAADVDYLKRRHDALVDGTIAGLVGASPGASTAVPAMLDVMERCFADRYQAWLPKLKEMVPSLGTELSGEPALFEEVWSWGTKVLKLDKPANGLPPARHPVESGADTTNPATAVTV
jgi:L-2-hydroxyglutarate oxidase LhgO